MRKRLAFVQYELLTYIAVVSIVLAVLIPCYQRAYMIIQKKTGTLGVPEHLMVLGLTVLLAVLSALLLAAFVAIVGWLITFCCWVWGKLRSRS